MYTLGRWVIYERSPCAVHAEQERGEVLVAQCGSPADAELTAAAPELLAALKAAEWIMRSHIMPEHFDGHAARAMEQVRAAIAKAEHL